MRSLHKIIIMKEFIIIFMLLFPSITPIKTNSSIPDFGRMMNQKREDIKRLRESFFQAEDGIDIVKIITLKMNSSYKNIINS